MPPRQINPEIVKRARDAAAALAGQAKESFVPGDSFKAAQPMPQGGMPQGMPPGGAPPMDPSMMGGAPMPPGPPGAPMPPGAPAPPGAPMPPEMGGPPPGGEMGGGPGGQPVVMSMEDLVSLFEQIQGQEGSGEGDNEPTTTNVRIGERMERLEGKIDDLASMLAQVMGLGGEGGPPPGEGGAMPPGGEMGGVDPALLAQLGGVPPGGPPMETVGAPMPPEMAAGMPPPMAPPGAPPMPPGAMMPQAGNEADEGITKRSAMKIGALVAKLRKK